MKKLLLAASFFMVILFLGRNLNPFSSNMFTFHDSTQPARIQQFNLNLKQLNIPPRIAPDFNFRIGYPVFNFYAPFSYWITSTISMLGADVVSSLKLSFLLALLIGFIGSYLFLRAFFEYIPSLLGSFIYITSLYFPLNIFVRGNLAEIWFLSLFPLILYFLFKNSLKVDYKLTAISSVFLSFLLTTHNIYSLIVIPFLLIFILILKNKKQNLLSLLTALMLTSYFWLPVFAEMKYTWAREVASITNFRDHFLCLEQLWQSSWGYGGSTKGCINDGMSFMIGKLQLIFGGLGIFIFLFKKSKEKYKRLFSFLFISTLVFLFLTLNQSKFLWELFSPLTSVIQFPWRFIGLSLLGISFFSAYFFNYIQFPYKNSLGLVVVIAVLFINGKYFHGQQINKKTFESKFLSQTYIEKKAAYAIAEYLPKTIDYNFWRSLQNKKIIPSDFITKATIEPFKKNSQTVIEKIGNALSLIGLIVLWKISRRKQ